MFYTYDKENLTFNKVDNSIILFFLTILILLTIGFTNIYTIRCNFEEYCYGKEDSTFTVFNESDLFTEELLIKKIKKLNIKYPHIVLAQARIESGWYSSPIFKENNNLFGMKKSNVRQNLQIGINRGHAVYMSWQESTIDYALFQARYLRVKSEAEYLQYLRAYYAKNPKYYELVKVMIKETELVFKSPN